jgi:hypothetical protein
MPIAWGLASKQRGSISNGDPRTVSIDLTGVRRNTVSHKNTRGAGGGKAGPPHLLIETTFANMCRRHAPHPKQAELNGNGLGTASRVLHLAAMLWGGQHETSGSPEPAHPLGSVHGDGAINRQSRGPSAPGRGSLRGRQHIFDPRDAAPNRAACTAWVMNWRRPKGGTYTMETGRPGLWKVLVARKAWGTAWAHGERPGESASPPSVWGMRTLVTAEG